MKTTGMLIGSYAYWDWYFNVHPAAPGVLMIRLEQITEQKGASDALGNHKN